MASSSSSLILCTSLLAVLLVQPGASDPLKDFLGPVFAPVMDNLCKMVECGKGKCRASSTGLSFVCDCEPGWKQALVPLGDDNLKFLPCVIPNCTLDYTCSSAPSPSGSKNTKTTGSVLDPCSWADCGQGTCNKTSTFTHTCQCDAGYSNLLNVTSFPCLKECSISADCLKLGIPVGNTTVPGTPTLPEKSTANAIYQWSTIWLAVLAICSSSMLLL